MSNENIYEELNDALDNLNKNKEEIKNLVDNAPVVIPNEPSNEEKRTEWKPVKPLDLFDDTREGGPGNIKWISETPENDFIKGVGVQLPAHGKVFADDPVEDEILEEALECEDKCENTKCEDAVDSYSTYMSPQEYYTTGYLHCDEVVNQPSNIHERKLVEYSFGKNGQGITDELTKIGQKIEALAKDNYVYLADAKLDPLDDVYNLTVEIYEHK